MRKVEFLDLYLHREYSSCNAKSKWWLLGITRSQTIQTDGQQVQTKPLSTNMRPASPVWLLAL